MAAAAGGTVRAGAKIVKPIISLNNCEAHTRVIGLYRAFYRYIPYIVKYFDIPKSENDCRIKIKELFYKNADVVDVRVIDILVIKGYMELKEITHQWMQKGHVMSKWNPTLERQPCGFVEKFLHGKD